MNIRLNIIIYKRDNMTQKGKFENNLNMGRLLSILLFAVFAIIIISCHKGDGNIITSEKMVSSFEEVSISSNAQVSFHESQEYRVVLTVDENLLKYVKITEKNNILHVGTKNGSYSFTKFMVDVYCPLLTEVSISGSGSFETLEKIVVPTFKSKISGSGKCNANVECDNFAAEISGSGSFNTNVECDNLTATISGSGNITVNGTSNNSTVKISGSGKFKGIEFKTNNADIRVSGSGDVYTWATDYLKAYISGSGDITYRGTPKIDFSGSGSGRIKSE